MHRTTNAIILKKIAYGESDLIITFFGRDGGRMSGIAKSARVSQRRFGGALELGSLVDLRYVPRRGTDLVRIEDTQVNVPTTGIMSSLERLGALSRALELALAFLPEHQAAPEKFDLLAGHIFNLSREDPVPASVIAFELKWLSLVGYGPALENCMKCGGEPKAGETWSFSLDQGGIFCPHCVRRDTRRIEINEGAVRNMRNLAMEEEADLGQAETRSIQRLLAAYVEHILGRPLSGRQISQGW
jgi:DNA repair protein RecO (recombination protein O)